MRQLPQLHHLDLHLAALPVQAHPYRFGQAVGEQPGGRGLAEAGRDDGYPDAGSHGFLQLG